MIMQKEQIFEIINKNPVIFLATIEGSEPRVRGMMLYKADESGIVFHTGPHKDVYHQLMKNPNVQMCHTTLKFSEKLYQAASPLVDKIKFLWYESLWRK